MSLDKYWALAVEATSYQERQKPWNKQNHRFCETKAKFRVLYEIYAHYHFAAARCLQRVNERRPFCSTIDSLGDQQNIDFSETICYILDHSTQINYL
jgi:hypothetical protein